MTDTVWLTCVWLYIFRKYHHNFILLEVCVASTMHSLAISCSIYSQRYNFFQLMWCWVHTVQQSLRCNWTQYHAHIPCISSSHYTIKRLLMLTVLFIFSIPLWRLKQITNQFRYAYIQTCTCVCVCAYMLEYMFLTCKYILCTKKMYVYMLFVNI